MQKLMIAILTLIVFGFTLPAFAQTEMQAEKNNLYLVTGSGGPGFTSPEQAVEVLEKGILPTFDAIMKMQKENKVIAGGLPLGERAVVFIVQASSNSEVDKLLRGLPAWSVLTWEVKALESFAGRAAQEREIVKQIKSMK